MQLMSAVENSIMGYFPLRKGQCYAQKIWLPVVLFLIDILKDSQEDLESVVPNGKLVWAGCLQEVPHLAQSPGSLADFFLIGSCDMGLAKR